MPRSKKSVVKKDPAAVAVQQILSLFGPPPLLSTERREHFEQILAQFVAAIAPADAIVQMWVYDVAVLTWEMMRLRRYKAEFIEMRLPGTIRGIAETSSATMVSLTSPPTSSKPKSAHSARRGRIRRGGMKRIAELILALLQARRDAIIREIGAYRDSLARRVKKAVDDVAEVPEDEVGIAPRLTPPARNKSTAA